MRAGSGDVLHIANHLSLSLEETERVNSFALALALLRPADAESIASLTQSCRTRPRSLEEHSTAIITECRNRNAMQE